MLLYRAFVGSKLAMLAVRMTDFDWCCDRKKKGFYYCFYKMELVLSPRSIWTSLIDGSSPYGGMSSSTLESVYSRARCMHSFTCFLYIRHDDWLGSFSWTFSSCNQYIFWACVWILACLVIDIAQKYFFLIDGSSSKAHVQIAEFWLQTRWILLHAA